MLNQLRLALLTALVPVSIVSCVESDPEVVESAFDAHESPAHAAAAFSEILNDQTFATALRAQLAERRTGDFEVLLSDLVDISLADGRTVRDVLAPTGILDGGMPFHVAAPLGLDRWSEGSAPLVT